MTASPRYRVGMVSKLTGLSTHVLRVWERRYGAVVPERTPKGGRLYSDEDVARLRLLADAVSRGHAIGTIANLSTDELNALGRGKPAGPAPEAAAETPNDHAVFVEACCDALGRFDLATVEQLLGRAAVAFAPRELVLDVVRPILLEVGDRWNDGRFRIAHEHAATGIVRGLLGALVRVYGHAPSTRPHLFCTTPGERHEFGVLMAALLCASRRVPVIYLGADLPMSEVGFAAEETDASAIIIGATCVAPDPPSLAAMAALASDRRRVIAGGSAIPRSAPPPIEILERLEDYDLLLEQITGL